MRVSILAIDNFVIVDNSVGLPIDCSQLVEDNIHAVQWYGDYGEVEFTTEYLAKEKRWHREPNEVISSFKPFQRYVDAWREKKVEYDAEQKRIQDLIIEQARVAQEMEKKIKADQAKFLTQLTNSQNDN